MLENELILTMGSGHSEESHGVAVAPAKPKLEKPSMYQVVMLNDDYTPMDFVIEVLSRFFSMDLEKCTEIMMAVHTQGKAVCGTYTKDIAQTKAAQVMAYAEEHEHPLMCDVQRIK
ncbi:MAG: ATP-dependent Clp protease adapter ClpS [Bermanella sp.]